MIRTGTNVKVTKDGPELESGKNKRREIDHDTVKCM